MNMARLPLPTYEYVYAVMDKFEIVYVGLSTDVNQRAYQHRHGGSPWITDDMEFVVLSKHLPGRGHSAEAAAINKHKPKFNVHHTGSAA